MIDLINRVNKKRLWDKQPIFCFTSDIDWASDAIMKKYFDIILPLKIKPTLFLTHRSPVIELQSVLGNINTGIHPNFLKGSSHGSNFKKIIETCKKFKYDIECFRTHRSFDVTDTNHLLKNNYGFKYCSNTITIMQSQIRPVLLESGLINFPVFFEDGTHLYNKMDFDISKYEKQFHSSGIKIISFHPMNFVFNSPSYKWMRSLKDSMTKTEYQNIASEQIQKLKNTDIGIGDITLEIIDFVKQNNYSIMSLKEIYELTIK